MINFAHRLVSFAFCVALHVLPAAALEVETHTTPAGYQFDLMKVPKATQTVIRIVWKGGNGFLPDGKENVDELGPVMLVNGGSEGLSPDELQRQVNALGAGFQVYSKLDALHGMLIAPNDKLAETAALLNTVLAKPTMDGRWLRRFKRNFVENVSTNAKTPSGQAWLTIREVTVGDHPYRQIWNATPVENISSITIADIKDWHRRVVTSDGVRVFVAGKAEVTDIAAAVDIVLEGLPTGSGRQDFPQLEMSYPAKTILVHRPEAEKSYLLIGGPVPKIYAPNQEAREIGVGVLGVSDQSRLFTAVRKELRAAYGFKAWMDSFSRENAMIYMQGEVETAKLQDAYDTVRDTYEELRTDGIGLIEFPFAQRIFKNRAYGIAEKPRGAANLMVEAWLTGRPVEDGLRYPERAAGLSRGSVNQAIQDEFPPFSQMVKIVVSPDRDAVVADCIIADFSEADRCR